MAYFSEVAKLREITLELNAEPDVYLYFNPTKLQRIVDNNLSNAIKYSREKGDVQIKLFYRAGKVWLRFKDQGVGIEKPERIFQRYYRENEAKGGFGIGLAIVKAICDEEKVEIRVNSVVGKGSRFSYCFTTPGGEDEANR